MHQCGNPFRKMIVIEERMFKRFWSWLPMHCSDRSGLSLVIYFVYIPSTSFQFIVQGLSNNVGFCRDV